MDHTTRAILYYAVVILIAAYLLNQVRKPSRWIGRGFVWVMNLSHSGLTDWGLQHVPIEKRLTILDVGCGGGRTIQKLAAMSADGTIYGVDYAAGSVAASRARNAELIKNGRVQIHRASVSQLPFPDNQFDLVTAVETQYYWPDLPNDMREILRVLKPGGTLIVIAEHFKGGKFDLVQLPVMKLLRSSHLSLDDHRTLFANAGYVQVQTFDEKSKGWFCGVGQKPPASGKVVENT